MKKLSLAYFGSSSFSADLLEKIINDKFLPIQIKFVITQPDKPVGRNQILTPTAVKTIAGKYKIDSENFGESQLSEQVSPDGVLGFRGRRKDERSRRPLTGGVGRRVDLSRKFLLSKKLQETDLALVYAYAEIIPADLLNLPKFGFWNIHPSLLPKYRGPSPIAYPLILGDTETGVTIIKLDEQLDHGPIVAQEKLLIMSTDKRPYLEKKLTDLGFEMLKKEIKKLANGNLQLTDQNDKNATCTRLLTKQDGYVAIETLRKSMRNNPLTIEDLPQIISDYLKKNPKLKVPACRQARQSSKKTTFNAAEIIFNLFRGLIPWPGIWTMVNINNQQKRLKIIDLELVNNKLVINKVQLEGKHEVDFEQFNSFYRIFQLFEYSNN